MRFVLVHGGCHGAWCWAPLVGALRGLGCQAVAMDWPGHGTRRDESPTLDGFRAAVAEVLRPGDVIVAHSTGCMVATLAADTAPDLIRHFVFLAGPLPVEGETFFESMGGTSGGPEGPKVQAENAAGADRFLKFSDDGKSIYFPPDGARQAFFHDLDTATQDWAIGQLTPMRVDHLFTEKISVPRFWRADLPRSFIQCLQDQAFPASLAAEHCRRLGVKPLTIDASHSPFLSRPAELASIVLAAVETRPCGPLLPFRRG